MWEKPSMKWRRWVNRSRPAPQMIAVQAEGCQRGARMRGRQPASSGKRPHGCQWIARAKPLGDFLILEAVRKSGGTAIAVSDDH